MLEAARKRRRNELEKEETGRWKSTGRKKGSEKEKWEGDRRGMLRGKEVRERENWRREERDEEGDATVKDERGTYTRKNLNSCRNGGKEKNERTE